VHVGAGDRLIGIRVISAGWRLSTVQKKFSHTAFQIEQFFSKLEALLRQAAEGTIPKL
jgi:hypothetical protein